MSQAYWHALSCTLDVRDRHPRKSPAELATLALAHVCNGLKAGPGAVQVIDVEGHGGPAVRTCITVWFMVYGDNRPSSALVAELTAEFLATNGLRD